MLSMTSQLYLFSFIPFFIIVFFIDNALIEVAKENNKVGFSKLLQFIYVSTSSLVHHLSICSTNRTCR